MLVLAFLGVVATDMTSDGWEYWKWMIPVFALMTLWLSWYERRKQEAIRPITLWRELLHWVGLFGAIVLVETYVQVGLLSRFLASLVALTMLSLTVFTIGIYVEWFFIVIGIVLGFFALIIATSIEFLYAFTIPALVLGIAVLWFLHWRGRHHKQR